MKNLVLISISMIFAVLCAEFVARLVGYAPFEYRKPASWQLRIFERDTQLGWRNKPGKHKHSFLPDNGYPITTTISPEGSRVSPGSRPDAPTIEIYGGSMGFGWGVTDGETVGDILARKTGAKVINRAAGGYGSLQALMIMQKVAKQWTKKVAKPSALVYLQATHHMNRSAGEPSWLLSNERNNPRNGKMVGIPYARFDNRDKFVMKPAQRYWEFPLREHSALINMAEQAWVKFSWAISDAEMLRGQAELIRRMSDLTQKHGVKLYVIAVYSQTYQFKDLREAVRDPNVNWAYCTHRGYPKRVMAESGV